MTGHKSLSAILYNLSNCVISEVDKAKKNKLVCLTEKNYIKTEISNIVYEKGIKAIESMQVPVSKDEWKWDLQGQLDFNENVNKCRPFKESAEKIAQMYDVKLEKSKYWVRMFVEKIISSSLDGVTDENIVELVTLFIGELESNPILWEPTVWITGIWMDAEFIEIQDNILIRKPEQCDLEIATGLASPDSYLTTPSDVFSNLPTAILDLEYREKYPINVQKNINSVITALRLFKVGSVIASRIRLNGSSIISPMGGTTFGSGLISTNHDYGLTEEEKEPLSEFVATIGPLVYSEIIDKTPEESDYLSIAHDRYCDALLKPVVAENRLATAMMALEALYLKEEELGELTERLAQRVAMALEPFGYKASDVYDRVKVAYGIRSKFVHGSKIEQEGIPKLVERILDYCRLSIIMFLQLHIKLEKDEMINLLSSSLLDSTKKEKLHDLITNNCQAPNLPKKKELMAEMDRKG